MARTLTPGRGYKTEISIIYAWFVPGKAVVPPNRPIRSVKMFPAIAQGVGRGHKMILAEKIERVFAHRTMPETVVDMANCLQIDSDVEEALWFTGRDWHSITWDDWQKHSGAITFFSNKALGYYLPSVLLLSLQTPQEALTPAESLIWELDRSPSSEGWDDHFAGRFRGLKWTELDVLKEWLLQICEYIPYKRWGKAASGPGDTFGRAFDTIDLLQKEIRQRPSTR